MFRTLILTLIVASCVVCIAGQGQTILGLFRKVFIEPSETVEKPTFTLAPQPILQPAFVVDNPIDKEHVNDNKNDGNNANEHDTSAFMNITGAIEHHNDNEKLPHRIIGGQQISINQVPWQAALIQDRTFSCGASVISTIWVLTAAHCVFGFGNSTFVVRAGSTAFRTGGQARRVNLIAVHGQYNENTFSNDIAMLRVRRRFVFGTSVQPVRIASPYTRLPRVFVVSGWGAIADGGNPTRLLRGVRLALVGRTICAIRYAGQYAIGQNMMCTAAPGRDSCQGDSGGAVVSGGVQFGIISFGIGCALPRYPGINTNVKVYNTWISTVARSFSRSLIADDGNEVGTRLIVV